MLGPQWLKIVHSGSRWFMLVHGGPWWSEVANGGPRSKCILVSDNVYSNSDADICKQLAAGSVMTTELNVGD